MLTTFQVIAIALVYVGILFAIAAYGDRMGTKPRRGMSRPFIYALSIAVYCTSWTFFGSVGLASRAGFEFLTIYIGPILLFALGWPLIARIVSISKKQNITSIADFLSARYGKNQLLGGLAAGVAVIGVIPYISLQLKAVSISLATLAPLGVNTQVLEVGFGDIPMLVAVAMAIFAMLFGTRHADATEHQNGLIISVAAESLVKLVAFIVVGFFITFVMMGGPTALFERAGKTPEIVALFAGELNAGRLITMTFLAFCAVILLPRQFHLAVVENTTLADVRRASWLFPLYLVAINIFVIPIALAGLLMFPQGQVDGDTFVMALPVSEGHTWIALIAFLGGLSAATAMVIVETVALAIMVCNSIVVPIMLRSDNRDDWQGDMVGRILQIRRGAIAIIVTLAYSYYLMIGNNAALAQTGLISFAAVAQFAPAFFIGLAWTGGTARGAMAGLCAGFAIWAYTLLLPLFADAGWLDGRFVTEGLFGIAALRAHGLFGSNLDPLTHGVVWSIAANVAAYYLVSLLTTSRPIERMQAHAFAPPRQAGTAVPTLWARTTGVTVRQLQDTVARYLGAERMQRSFVEYEAARDVKLKPRDSADSDTVKFAENLLAGSVGTASARVVMALLLERRSAQGRGAMRLLDDASDAILHNRDLLQSAIDHVRQGIAVVDQDLALVCWNIQFRQLLRLPSEVGRVGVPLATIVEAIDPRFMLNETSVRDSPTQLIRMMSEQSAPFSLRHAETGTVIEVRMNPMPDDGRVIVFSDITERVRAAEALEQRVRERTTELTALNAELESARSQAVEANIDKTRFIAAASHDILQPLNAARLFTTSLQERSTGSANARLVQNIDRSLESVEDILSTLLDISRLDAGAMHPEITEFPIAELLDQLRTEFSVAAERKSLRLSVVACGLTVRSDRKLLRRILQNLLSNAIKYTSTGRVVMGCRRTEGGVRIEVHDTGPGIAPDKQSIVFAEFERLAQPDGDIQGLGLGLSIVERMARVLDHPLSLRSQPDRGSCFSIHVPVSEPSLRPPGAVVTHRIAAASHLTGLRVLVVDNEATIVEGMQSLLEGWGCIVSTAHDAEEVMRLFGAEGSGGRVFDVVLMDYHLGDDDGLELIGKLQADGFAFDALLITAEASSHVQDRACHLGVGFMRKPVKPARLRAALSATVNSAAAAE